MYDGDDELLKQKGLQQRLSYAAQDGSDALFYCFCASPSLRVPTVHHEQRCCQMQLNVGRCTQRK
jgi:hypothetical protein